MKKNQPSTVVLILSVIIGVGLGVADAFFDAFLFGSRTFMEELLSPSPIEIYMRVFILVIVVAYGLFTSRIVARLVNANKEIKTLRGSIPMCAACKKIRDDSAAWHDVADYVRSHSEAEFSHGLCPSCEKKQIDEIEKWESGH